MHRGLQDPQIMRTKEKAESEFKALVASKPEWKSAYGNAWNEIAEAESKAATRATQQYFRGTNSDLANTTATVVDYVTEIRNPDGERLPGFHDSQSESLRFSLLSPAPVYPAMEIARMAGALQLDLQELGADDPFVKIALDGKTPEAAATQWLSGTKLADPAVQKKLIEGGETAVAASDDSMIVLERRLDPLRREAIKWQQDNVQSVEQRAGEQPGKARFGPMATAPIPTRPLPCAFRTARFPAIR